MSHGTSAQYEELERVIENGCIAAVLQNNRLDILYFTTEQIGAEMLFASLHPVDISSQCIDFAIVAEESVWMSPIPARERVGTETGVHHGDSTFDIRLVEFRIIEGNLLRKQHPLVDNRSGRKAADIEIVAPKKACSVFHPFGDATTDNVELAFKLLLRSHTFAAGNENCLTTGSCAFAVLPSEVFSVGTLRNPRNFCPSACTIWRHISSIALRCEISGGMNAMPTA